MNKKMRLLVLGVLALMILVPLFTFAAGLVPCGDKGEPACTLCNLFDLAQSIINWLTTIIAPAIAVLAFTVGGFKILMSGPNPGYRTEGIKAIRNGVIGLLIVFGSWIIVNEFLLFFVGSQNIVQSGSTLVPWSQITCIPPIPVPESTAATDDYSISQANTFKQLRDVGFVISSSKSYNGNEGALCVTEAEAKTGGCTSLAYLPQNAINGLLNLKSLCGCNLVITGGTEPAGHVSHGFYKPNVDLRLMGSKGGLEAYIFKNTESSKNTSYGMEYTLKNGDTFLKEPNHWHVVFH